MYVCVNICLKKITSLNRVILYPLIFLMRDICYLAYAYRNIRITSKLLYVISLFLFLFVRGEGCRKAHKTRPLWIYHLGVCTDVLKFRLLFSKMFRRTFSERKVLGPFSVDDIRSCFCIFSPIFVD